MKIIFGLFVCCAVSCFSASSAAAKHCSNESWSDRLNDADDRRNTQNSSRNETPYTLSTPRVDDEEVPRESWQDALRHKRDNQK